MLGIHDLGLFVVSGLLLNLMPGPDSLLIMTRSAAQGARAGCVAAMGIGAGVFVHVLAAALGLSALLQTSPMAFAVVKYIGAAYILFLAWTLLRSKSAAAAASKVAVKAPPLPWPRVFAQGFLTNLLNPKVALFFLAFVPQFIDAAAPHKALSFIVLGCIFNFNGMLWCNALAWLTARASASIELAPGLVRWLNRLTGCVFIWLGVKLALSKNS
ncbi:LysE family translocator [Massilia sp. PWRC2]|uniref:LysE family translocator n=1 Tax=Massilia sp. PWRC2 TaxID=2804626 RepID=UPI003CE8ED40